MPASMFDPGISRRASEVPTQPVPTGPVQDSTATTETNGAPRSAGDAGIWLLYGAVGFVSGQVVGAILLLVVAAANGHLRDVSQLATRTVPPGWIVVSGLVGLWSGFLLAVFLASGTRGTKSVRRDMGLRFRWSDLLVGPAVGIGGQVILLPLLYIPVGHFVRNLNQRLSQPAKHLTGGFPGRDVLVIAVLTVAVVPVIEELLFRGLLLRALVRLFRQMGPVVGPVLAITLTGIAFGLAHFEVLQFLGLAAFGVVLSLMAYKFRRLGPCITAHATFNLIAVLVVTSNATAATHV